MAIWINQLEIETTFAMFGFRSLSISAYTQTLFDFLKGQYQAEGL